MGMFTEADGRLRSWLGTVVGPVPVRAEAPSDDVTGTALTAYLIGLEPTAPLSRAGQRFAPTVVRLRYLVCADAPDAADVLRLLEAVVTAALDLPAPDGHGIEA